MTVPYVAGTVSVTAGNAVVTGSGTGWQTALIAGGLFGLDSNNGNPVPILSVDSNTQITLAKPWRGTTAAGQAYWIVRDTDPGRQTVANASALAQIIADLRSTAIAAIAGITPATDKIAYFSGNSVATLTEFKEKGRDIVGADNLISLLGKLGPVFGGIAPNPIDAGVGMVDGNFDTLIVPGVYTISGEWMNGPSGAAASSFSGLVEVLSRRFNNLYVQILRTGGNPHRVYRRSGGSPTSWGPWVMIETPTVGSVSQSGGEPRGAIIERGSNTNGEYIRFADGTQICWVTGFAGLPTEFAAGSVFRSDIINWTFPAAFTSAASTSGSVSAGSTAYWANGNFTSSTVCSARLFSPTSGGGASLNFVAIGRWF